MTRNEQLLENLVTALVLEPDEGDIYIMVQKVHEAWLRRLKALYPQLSLKLALKCDEILKEFLRQYPPRSWNALFFGGELPKYLKELAASRKVEKYIPEIADFEWALYWVGNAPAITMGTDVFMLNPFVRYLRFHHGVWQWWETKKNVPELKEELVIVTKDGEGNAFVFEPTLIEAAVIDVVTEMSVSLEELIRSIQETLSDATVEQIEEAIGSLTLKGVIRGPALSKPKA